MKKINIVTLFPEFFKSPLETGVLGRAVRRGLIKIRFVNPREFAEDKHQSVDDSPFGGGDGMIMQYDPLKKPLLSLSQNSKKQGAVKPFARRKKSLSRRKAHKVLRPERSKNIKTIYLSPQGKKWDHKSARAFAEQNQELVFICGRYGGVDQRFVSEYVDEEISVGDYVLTGGEPAGLVILDGLSRFLKGALGNKDSSREESFEKAFLLEAPQWSRPQNIKGHKIPEVILSGHHKKIQNFRYLLSVFITALKRPDLLALSPLAGKDLPKAIKLVQTLSPPELRACGIPKDWKKAFSAINRRS